jgi:16S rRNA C967 or C1407 C5-methylase (RsmB/RsmF family)
MQAFEPQLWNHADVPGCLQSLPHRDGTEGFFIARLQREAAP